MSAAHVSKNRVPKPGRKTRIPLSCEPCRSRKLKCNRDQPCQNCIVRENPAGCFFRGVEKPPPVVAARASNAGGMQQRIDRLESLVTDLMKQAQVPAKLDMPPDEPAVGKRSELEGEQEDVHAAVQHGMGVLSVNGTGSLYRGTTHWHDVLKELHDLKSYWGQVQEAEEDILQTATPSDELNGPSLFCGIVPPITMEEILATLPARAAGDKILDRFFDEEASPVPNFHFLHRQTFMKEYDAYWRNPNQTSVMWIGLYFAILSQTMISYHMSDDEPPEYRGISQSISDLYRLRVAQCLMIGDISKCAPYTLEALVFYTMSEWSRKFQNQPRVWMMVGLLTRVALQMGYHRDPSHYPNITVFQGEIRRRLWCFIYRSDSITSFFVGLPSMIRATEQDVAAPRNLNDWELTEDMTELPPSRPLTETTSVSYLLIKGQILEIMGRIVDFMSSLQVWDYESVLKLDQDLEEVMENLPDHWKMQKDGDTSEVSPSLINRRLQVMFLYHQGMCVLHRKFVAQARSDERFSRSRSRCIRSAMVLLAQQYDLYVEKDIKQTIASKHWYRPSHTSQEYVLAAMIVVLELRHRKLEVFGGDMDVRAKEEAEMIEALQNACLVWKTVGNYLDAVKVYRVLSNMLAQFVGADEFRNGVIQELAQMPVSTAQQAPGCAVPDPALAGEMEIDWSAWDSFVEGSSFGNSHGTASFQ